MHTFYFCAGIPSNLEKKNINQVIQITKEIMPTANQRLNLQSEYIPEIKGGFFIFSSEGSEYLFDTFISPDIVIMFFGSLFDAPKDGMAEKIGRHWKQEGIEYIQRLNGLFSVIIVDRKMSRVYLVSDSLGNRTCRYRIHDDGSFHISTHDLPLVAAGGLEPELDKISIALSLSFDWSVGGYSLLKGIEVTDPFNLITWDENQGFEKSPAPTLIEGTRISSVEDPQFELILDEMINLLSNNVAGLAIDKSDICVDLTAGLDSRAMLGLAIKAVGPSRTIARTRGEMKSLDARIAARLASRLGIEYQLRSPDKNLDQKISWFSDAVGFGFNGDSSSKSFWNLSDTMIDKGLLHINGTGGEIFRGFYYPNSDLEKLSKDDIQATIFDSKKFNRSHQLPWKSKEYLVSMKERVSSVITELTRISDHPADILDLFYTHERVAHWGVHHECHPVEGANVSPFKQPELVRLGFRMPPGSGSLEYLHAALIERFIPEVSWIPINASKILLPSKSNQLKQFRRSIALQAMQIRNSAFNIVPWRIRQIFRTDGDHYVDNLFNVSAAEYTRDSLLSSDSIGLRMFNREGMEMILHSHMRFGGYGEEIGLLLAMNSWWRQIESAHKLTNAC